MRSAASLSSVAQASVDDRQSGLNILAVDADPAINQLTALILSKDDHQVEAVNSAEQALTRLTDQSFDMVMTGVRLGAGISGWQLAAEVRQRWPSMRIVLMTAWEPSIDTPLALHPAHVDAVVAKPYAVNGLRGLVARIASEINQQRDGAGGM
jgi:DNA-binding NtrC family response regulator